MKECFYQIAEHTIRLSFSKNKIGEDQLTNYAPFRVEETESYLFHLALVEQLQSKEVSIQVGQFDDDIASIGIFKSEAGDFRFRIAYPDSKDYCTMCVDSSFREARVQLPEDEQHRFFCLNNCLMLLYAFATANLDTLLIHASVIKNNNKGFVFLGKSGTGKSTHSRLWIEYIEGSELLNDDNPVIRLIEDKAYVFGTPWSGKTPCYINNKALLKGIVKLRQASENRIKELPLIQAYAALLPSCSNMRWEDNIASGVHRTVEQLINLVNCYRLDCLPNKAAAKLSSDTMCTK
ncbi:MAG: hypothetical protein ACK5KT_01655 [Dysgonomonas sp.]